MRNEDLKVILDNHFTAVRATIKSEVDRVDEKVSQVIKHQERQNSKLEKHDEKIIAIETCDGVRIGKMVGKKWFWIVAVAFVSIVYFILEALYNGTGLGELIEKLI